MFSRWKTAKEITALVCTRRNASRIGAGLALTGLSMALNLLTPLCLSTVVQALATQEAVVILGVEFSPLALTGTYGAVWTLSSVVSTLRDLVLVPLDPTVKEKLAERYVEKQITGSLQNYLDTNEGFHNGMLSKCYMSQLSTQFLTQIFPTTTEISIAIGMLSKWYGVEIGLELAAMLVVYTGFNLATKNHISNLRDDMNNVGFQTYKDTFDTLAKYESIQNFNMHKEELTKLRESLKKFTDAQVNAEGVISKIGIGQSLITGTGFSILSMLVARGVLSGRYSVSDFVTIVAYLLQFSGRLNSFGSSINHLLASLTELGPVFKLLNEAPQRKTPSQELKVDRSTASIEFEKVSFKYNEKKMVLNELSFRIAPGQKVAIVAGTGVGKSTILRLLLGYYSALSGVIRINGQNIDEVNPASIRRSISIVPQSTLFFNDTLYKNVEYAGLSLPGGVSNTQVLAAIKAACLDDVPSDTKVGERGDKLSGGQKQRVAIARAVLRNPDVIILDEATSSLDAHMAQSILTNIKKIFAGVTTIMVTHRLADIETLGADNILVLEAKGVAEQGTHQELLKKEGIYAELWRKQNATDAPLSAAKKMDNDLVKVAAVSDPGSTPGPIPNAALVPSIAASPDVARNESKKTISTSSFAVFTPPSPSNAVKIDIPTSPHAASSGKAVKIDIPTSPHTGSNEKKVNRGSRNWGCAVM